MTMKSDRSPSSRRPAAPWAVIILGLAVCAAAAAQGGAAPDEAPPMAASASGDSHYVIKVTPTLVYLDVGQAAGAVEGQSYVIAREQGGRFVRVGQVRVIRVADGFSIAEIAGVEPGEEIAVLHLALEASLWEGLAPELVGAAPAAPVAEPVAPSPSRWAFIVLGGADLGKDVDLAYAGTRIAGVDAAHGGAVGVRLARTCGRYWRLGLGYRLSGKPLSAKADVTQSSVEADLQLLLRGAGRPGPYLGVGAAFHQLGWDAPGSAHDTTYKAGGQLTGGLEFPVGGRWSLLLEGAYQKAMAWDDLIDASSVRAYAGLGRSF